jgi:hypothetical protein
VGGSLSQDKIKPALMLNQKLAFYCFGPQSVLKLNCILPHIFCRLAAYRYIDVTMGIDVFTFY